MGELESTEKLIVNHPIVKKKNGGARPGAGRPRHSKNASTITREAAAKIFKDRVAKHVDKIFHAQMDVAIGEKYLMVVRTFGKGAKQRRETSIVTDIETIKRFLDSDFDSGMGEENEYYFMSTKPANNSALDSLLNRSFGKAPESLDLTSGGDKITNIIYLPQKKTEDYDKEK